MIIEIRMINTYVTFKTKNRMTVIGFIVEKTITKYN